MAPRLADYRRYVPLAAFGWRCGSFVFGALGAEYLAWGKERGTVPECPILGRIAQEVVAVAAVTAGKVFLGQTIFVCFF